jgi:hypothetical protein
VCTPKTPNPGIVPSQRPDPKDEAYQHTMHTKPLQENQLKIAMQNQEMQDT